MVFHVVSNVAEYIMTCENVVDTVIVACFFHDINDALEYFPTLVCCLFALCIFVCSQLAKRAERRSEAEKNLEVAEEKGTVPVYLRACVLNV